MIKILVLNQSMVCKLIQTNVLENKGLYCNMHFYEGGLQQG